MLYVALTRAKHTLVVCEDYELNEKAIKAMKERVRIV